MAKTMGNTMSLKVIGAGFGRTGTKSLKQALEVLGFAACYAQLMARYPDARVILTVRDPDRWYESVLNTLYAMGKLTAAPPMSWVEALFAPHQHRLIAVTSRLWDELFGGRFEDRQHAIDVFTRYNADVQRRVPADGCWSTMSSRAGSRCARSWG